MNMTYEVLSITIRYVPSALHLKNILYITRIFFLSKTIFCCRLQTAQRLQNAVLLGQFRMGIKTKIITIYA